MTEESGLRREGRGHGAKLLQARNTGRGHVPPPPLTPACPRLRSCPPSPSPACSEEPAIAPQREVCAALLPPPPRTCHSFGACGLAVTPRCSTSRQACCASAGPAAAKRFLLICKRANRDTYTQVPARCRQRGCSWPGRAPEQRARAAGRQGGRSQRCRGVAGSFGGGGGTQESRPPGGGGGTGRRIQAHVAKHPPAPQPQAAAATPAPALTAPRTAPSRACANEIQAFSCCGCLSSSSSNASRALSYLCLRVCSSAVSYAGSRAGRPDVDGAELYTEMLLLPDAVAPGTRPPAIGQAACCWDAAPTGIVTRLAAPAVACTRTLATTGSPSSHRLPAVADHDGHGSGRNQCALTYDAGLAKKGP